MIFGVSGTISVMLYNVDGSKSDLARCVSAEIRARMGAQRWSANRLAPLARMSQNYLSVRLRDEKPFTLDDVEALLEVLAPAQDWWQFFKEASERHAEDVWADMEHVESLPSPEIPPIEERTLRPPRT